MPHDASAIAAVHRTRKSGGRLSALIFDVDGTLYEQAPVRRAMLYRLLRAHLTSPAQGFLTLRALQSYRRAQEELRGNPPDSGDIASAQIQLAARSAGVSEDVLGAWVARWMEQEPLPFLAHSIRKATVELLETAKNRGLRLAVCSDYPAERKLAAMGIADYFDVVVTAQDPRVQRFKPDPTGLELTIRELAVQKDEVVYIGDRADVDAVAASHAGVRHFILSPGQNFSHLLELLLRSQPVAVASGGGE